MCATKFAVLCAHSQQLFSKFRPSKYVPGEIRKLWWGRTASLKPNAASIRSRRAVSVAELEVRVCSWVKNQWDFSMQFFPLQHYRKGPFRRSFIQNWSLQGFSSLGVPVSGPTQAVHAYCYKARWEANHASLKCPRIVSKKHHRLVSTTTLPRCSTGYFRQHG